MESGCFLDIPLRFVENNSSGQRMCAPYWAREEMGEVLDSRAELCCQVQDGKRTLRCTVQDVWLFLQRIGKGVAKTHDTNEISPSSTIHPSNQPQSTAIWQISLIFGPDQVSSCKRNQWRLACNLHGWSLKVVPWPNGEKKWRSYWSKCLSIPVFSQSCQTTWGALNHGRHLCQDFSAGGTEWPLFTAKPAWHLYPVSALGTFDLYGLKMIATKIFSAPGDHSGSVLCQAACHWQTSSRRWSKWWVAEIVKPILASFPTFSVVLVLGQTLR